MEEHANCVPESLRLIYSGMDRPVHSQVDDQYPEWFDPVKFKKGQLFAQRNYFSVSFSELVSLYLFFSVKTGREPLIYTGKSDTPEKNCQRYLSTIMKVKSWYEGDIMNFQSGLFNEVKTVRGMHSSVCRQMNRLPKEMRGTISFSSKPNPPELIAPWSRDITEAFEEQHRTTKNSCSLLLDKQVGYISQTSMGLTQFGFMGLVSLYPEKFGIHDMAEEDLDNFYHFWRTIGHFLGIEDEANFCVGSHECIRQRITDAIEFVFMPQLTKIDESWEHLSRGMILGVSMFLKDVSFESTFLYLCWVLDLNLVPELYKRISWKEKLMFWFYKVLMTHLMRFDVVKTLMNRKTKSMLQTAMRRFGADKTNGENQR